jgi:hypothetical protein
MHTTFQSGNVSGRRVGDPGVDGRIILKWIFFKTGCGYVLVI